MSLPSLGPYPSATEAGAAALAWGPEAQTVWRDGAWWVTQGREVGATCVEPRCYAETYKANRRCDVHEAVAS